MADGLSRREQLAASLAAVEQRLRAACDEVGRQREELTLVAVTKSWPASDAALLRELGVRDLGENRDQEASKKAAEVDGVRWHFVGQLQSNKAKSVARYADVVHALDREQVVDALAESAERAGRTIEALVQVSLDGDPSRGGATVQQVPALAARVSGASGLRLAGVMAVAPLSMRPPDAFARLAAVATQVRREHPHATAISAGMSGDLEDAIAAGATIVRVGSAILGARPRYLG